MVGTFDLESKRKAGTMKPYIDNEPFWLNMEAFKAARVLITSRKFGYITCTMHEIHEASDTLVVRQGNVSTDTFVCFTSRYPTIFFKKNKIPTTSHQVVVKFDTWTAYRAGAMTYRNSASQWILTTGLPLESVVMVRDHLGHCFDLDTLTLLTTLEWKFMKNNTGKNRKLP